MIRRLESRSRLRVTPSLHQVAEIAQKTLRCLEAPHHIHHLSLWQGNHHLTCLRFGIVWKYR